MDVSEIVVLIVIADCHGRRPLLAGGLGRCGAGSEHAQPARRSSGASWRLMKRR